MPSEVLQADFSNSSSDLQHLGSPQRRLKHSGFPLEPGFRGRRGEATPGRLPGGPMVLCCYAAHVVLIAVV